MKPIYLHSAVCISAQNSFAEGEMEALNTTASTVAAKHPAYRNYIPPAAARRMAPAVKMGVVAANVALEKAQITQPDAILTGSGLGCIQDTEKFLNALLESNEQFVPPTAFIQSTHNAVGAQIALGLGCKAYNNTYVHGSLSFESALLDASLLLEDKADAKIVVGGVDELGTEFVNYVKMLAEKETPASKIPISEGASFFVVSSEMGNAQVLLRAMNTCRDISVAEISTRVGSLLKENGLSEVDIDTLILGTTGAESDVYYKAVSDAFPKQTTQIHFKKYAGQYNTSIGFAVWFAVQLLGEKNTVSDRKNILIYNQEDGRNHSVIIVSRC